MLLKKIILLLYLIVFPMFMIQNTKLTNDRSVVCKITYSSLYNHILNSQIKFPNVVLAQAIIESGHFESDVFNENNNLFGMKVPYVRKTLATKKNDSQYAYYNDWKQSVADYKLWQEFVLGDKKITEKEYLMLLKRIYAEDKNYINKILDIIGNV